LTRLCLGKPTQFGLHLFDFTHTRMMEWNLIIYKPTRPVPRRCKRDGELTGSGCAASYLLLVIG
jgi:hypothetical protein